MGRTSRAVVMTEPGTVEERELEVPDPGPDELLLRVELNGICGTDVHMNQGGMDLSFPVVPGHEFAGTVEEVGEDVATDSGGSPVAEGDRATVVPGISCGECWYCTNLPSRPLACEDRRVYGFRSAEDAPHGHGGMSEYVLIESDATFYRLPDGMPVEQGALVEPTSVATHALERAYEPGLPHTRESFGIGKTVAVQGAGPIGLLTCAAADHAGAGQVIAIDQIDERLDMAREFGATDAVDFSDYEDEDAFVDAVKERTPGGVGPDVVVEAVGHPDAVRQGIRLPRNAGTFVEVGHYADAGTTEINPTDVVQKELDIYGSLAYPPNQFETAISMLSRADDVPFTDLFNFDVGFGDAADAYEAQAAGEAYRATVRPGL